MAIARSFDITGFEAARLWDSVLRAGEDPVAVARASYAAGGPARHRVNATYVLIYEARRSAEARAFAVALLHDRSDKVVEFAAQALAWGLDRSHLPAMREALSRQTGAKAHHIRAAIAAVEAGNPDLFLDRKGTGCLHLRIMDRNWHAKKPGGGP